MPYVSTLKSRLEGNCASNIFILVDVLTLSLCLARAYQILHPVISSLPPPLVHVLYLIDKRPHHRVFTIIPEFLHPLVQRLPLPVCEVGEVPALGIGFLKGHLSVRVCVCMYVCVFWGQRGGGMCVYETKRAVSTRDCHSSPLPTAATRPSLPGNGRVLQDHKTISHQRTYQTHSPSRPHKSALLPNLPACSPSLRPPCVWRAPRW